MSFPVKPVVSAPGVMYRLWRFRRWSKARKKIAEQTIVEAIQLALFPHAFETDYAQYAAHEIWRLMKSTPVPGEVSQGPAGRAAAKAERLLYGRLPKASALGVTYQRRLSLWFQASISTPEGEAILRAVEAPELCKEDVADLGDLVAKLFHARLEVQRFHDPEVNRARVWLIDEIRKYDTDVGLAGRRRAETGVTQAIEGSSALVSGGVVTYLLDAVGIHGQASLAVGYGTAVLIYFGSKLALRRRPLLPRQIAFRLFVLETMSDFLGSAGGVDMGIDRTVASALDALNRVRGYVLRHPEEAFVPTQRELATPPRGSPADGLALHIDDAWTFVQVESADAAPDAKALAMVRLLKSRVEHLVEMSAGVDDRLVHAELMRLEAALNSARGHEQILAAIGGVLESLSK